MSLSKISIPTLSLRKDIWTHFPVCLIKIPRTDGRDRWAVQWHQKHLNEWSQDIPGYETITKMRLFKALMVSNKWNVERPAVPGDLCVIAMNFLEPKPLPDLFADNKNIETIDDIKQYYPVCWTRRDNTYSFVFHNTSVRALASEKGVDVDDIQKKTVETLIPILRTMGTVEITNEICELSL